MMCNNPNLDLININVYLNLVKFYQFVLKNIELTQNYDGRNYGRNEGQLKSNIAPTFSKQGYNEVFSDEHEKNPLLV